MAGAFLLDEVKKTNRRKQPSPVFMTSTLQQTAASKINFNAKKTMRVAQKLYEGIAIGEETEGLITYMRTDSTRMSEGFVSTALEYIQENYGKEYVGKYKNKLADNAQDAHEGIRVTGYHAHT